MITDELVLGFIKKSEHGVKFCTVAEQILETVVERVWFEDREGVEFIEKISEVIYGYMQFELRQAVRSYEAIQEELKTFVSGLRVKHESEIRINTWDKIVKILGMLVTQSKGFLEIATSEVTRLQQIPMTDPLQ